MQRLLSFGIVPLVLALLLAGSSQSASAHEHRVVLDGKYEFVVGFLNEPAVSDEVNSIDLRVTDLTQTTPAADGGEGVGTPVEGLESTLTVDIIFGDQTKTLDVQPRFRTPGAYNGWMIPVQPGDYAFHVYGTVNGAAVDEMFTPGPETFSSVMDRAALEFPQQSASASVAPMGSIDTQGGITGSEIGGGALIGASALLALFGLTRLSHKRSQAQVAPAFNSSVGD